MKRIFSLLTCALAVLITGALTNLNAAIATPLRTPIDCAAGILHGDYPFFAATTVTVAPGTVIALPEALLATSPAILAARGTVAFTDAGEVVLTATADRNGAEIAPTSYAGNYTLDDQCAVTANLVNGVSFTARVVGAAEPQRLAATTPGFVLVDQP